MNWAGFFSELGSKPCENEIEKLKLILPENAGVFEFYRQYDGGTIDNEKTFVRFDRISEILDLRASGNAGWSESHLFFASNGASEGIGVLLGEEEVYFSTQWIASDDDITHLGKFPEFMERLLDGTWI